MSGASRQEPPTRRPFKSAIAKAQSSLSRAAIILDEINAYLLAMAIGLAFLDGCLYVAFNLASAVALNGGPSDQTAPFSSADLGSPAASVSTPNFCLTENDCLASPE